MKAQLTGAFSLIFYKDSLLLFHRDNIPTIPYPDYWQLPGGGVEKGENSLQAIKRELYEEVSFVPNDLEFIGRVNVNGNINDMYVTFVNQDDSHKFKLGMDEGQEIKFFKFSEIANLNLTPGVALLYKEVVEKYNRNTDSNKAQITKILKLIIKNYSAQVIG